MSSPTDPSVNAPAPIVQNDVPVVNEVNNEPKVGDHLGQCKWWSDKLGYGFVTIQQGEMKGKDIFLHHSGIRPLNSIYRTLKKGEYINFDIIDGANGLQATNVTGVGGGTLICDVNPYVKPQLNTNRALPPPPSSVAPISPVAHPAVSYYGVPPPHTIAAAAYMMPRGSYPGGRGRGRSSSMPFSSTAPNRPYSRPRSSPPPPVSEENTSSEVSLSSTNDAAAHPYVAPSPASESQA